MQKIAPALDNRKTITVVQFTDTHLFAAADGTLLGVNTFASFKQVLELAQSQRGAPEIVLLTGDLSQDETDGAYRRLQESLEHIAAPKYYLPGNHDQGPLMAEVFGQGARAIELDRSFVRGRWQVILLDSTIPGCVGGHLSQAELERLDQCLTANPDHFALVCLHHQPVPVNSRWIDQIGVDNGGDLFAVLEGHRQVRAVLWGHVHQEFSSKHKGITLLSTPSTCVQFKPDSDGFAIDDRPPGYRWLELNFDGSLKTRVERLVAMPQGLDLTSRGY